VPGPKSMTGFGSGVAESAAGRFVVEARSVNHRHLKTSIRAPFDVGTLESEIEESLRARCSRGAVSIHVAVEGQKAGAPPPLDADAIAARVAELRALATRLRTPLSDAEIFAHALRLPGAAGDPSRAAANGSLDDDVRRAVLKAAGLAFDALAESRAIEGAKTAQRLREHAGVCENLRAEIAARMPDVVKGLRDRAVQRLEALLGELKPGLKPAEETLVREAGQLADRIDVSEETQRLASHLEHMETILVEGKDAGRRLDFLTQELLREANTIGSKASDVGVARLVVALKNEIEKLKEQVQNLE
jgi:uncharacterized protein (TIGR00255 family)